MTTSLVTPENGISAWVNIENFHPQHTLRIIEWPRNFFLRESEESKKLRMELYGVAVAAFNVARSKEFFDDVAEHVTETEILGVSSTAGVPNGFICINVSKVPGVLYVEGVAVMPALDCKAIGRQLILAMANFTKLQTCALTTQSPRMFSAAKSICSEIYPSEDGREIPAYLYPAARVLMSDRTGHFDERTFVSKDLYRTCLYDKIPLTGDAELNRWFLSLINVNEDTRTRDGILVMGKLKV